MNPPDDGRQEAAIQEAALQEAYGTVWRVCGQRGKPPELVTALAAIVADPLPILCDFLLYGNRRDVRILAARTLGHLGDNRAAPWLANALHDGERTVEQAAAEALGLLPVLALSKADEIIAALGATLRSGRTEVAVAAAKALGRIGGPEAMKCLGSVLLENSPSHDVVARAKRLTKALVGLVGGTEPPLPKAKLRARLAMVDALAAIGAPSVSILIRLLDDSDPTVRKRAADRLTEMGQAGREALVAALMDEDADVRLGAARALAAAGWQPPSLKDQILLGVVLEDERELRSTGDAATPLLCEMLADPAPWLRCAVAQVLGRQGEREALPALRKRLHPLAEFDGEVREAISAAIHQIEASTGSTSGFPRSLSVEPDAAARPRDADPTPE